jgi:shikimate kinase
MHARDAGDQMPVFRVGGLTFGIVICSDSNYPEPARFMVSKGATALFIPTNAMIRLIGPGGAGKSTIGAVLAERLNLPFLDLDRHLAGRVGDISEYINRQGYDAYARENVEAYCSLFRGRIRPDVLALSSGFMTYASDIHPEYGRLRHELEENARTFVLLPSLDREWCVAETVRRQIARPFGRSPEREEAVIRARFEIYMSLPMRKVETMRSVAAIVDEIVEVSTFDSLQQ